MSNPIERPVAPAAGRPYVPVIRAGGWIYTAGFTGTGADGVAPPQLSEQYRLILEKAAKHLASAGASLEQVVHVTVYLTDMADYAEFNRCFGETFGGSPPARTCVRVAGLTTPEKRLEMQFVVFRGVGGPG